MFFLSFCVDWYGVRGAAAVPLPFTGAYAPCSKWVPAVGRRAERHPCRAGRMKKAASEKEAAALPSGAVTRPRVWSFSPWVFGRKSRKRNKKRSTQNSALRQKRAHGPNGQRKGAHIPTKANKPTLASWPGGLLPFRAVGGILLLYAAGGLLSRGAGVFFVGAKKTEKKGPFCAGKSHARRENGRPFASAGESAAAGFLLFSFLLAIFFCQFFLPFFLAIFSCHPPSFPPSGRKGGCRRVGAGRMLPCFKWALAVGRRAKFPRGGQRPSPSVPPPKGRGDAAESARGVCCPAPSGNWQWVGAQKYPAPSGRWRGSARRDTPRQVGAGSGAARRNTPRQVGAGSGSARGVCCGAPSGNWQWVGAPTGHLPRRHPAPGKVTPVGRTGGRSRPPARASAGRAPAKKAAWPPRSSRGPPLTPSPRSRRGDRGGASSNPRPKACG